MGGLCGSGLGFAASAVPACAIFGLSAACPALVLAASHALSEPPHSEPRGTAGGSLAALGAAGAALLRALRLPSIYKPLCFFLLQNALVPSPAALIVMPGWAALWRRTAALVGAAGDGSAKNRTAAAAAAHRQRPIGVIV